MNKKNENSMEICLEKSPFESDVLECCINGNIVCIKRGENVQVKTELYELLKSAGLV